MSGARGVAEVYQAQWPAHLNSAVANAFRKTLAEKPPDPVAKIGRLLTARVDGPAPQFVSVSPSDPLSQAQSDTARALSHCRSGWASARGCRGLACTTARASSRCRTSRGLRS